AASENRVWRLAKVAGLQASHYRRRGKGNKPGPAVHDDLLGVTDDKGRVTHDFITAATEPNQVWLTDITEHWTGEGKLYLCAVKDCCSNKIVGYSIDSRMKSELAAAALRNAIALRAPAGTIVHSDRGSQAVFKRSKQHLACAVERSCSANASAGVRQPRISRGRLLMVSATAWISVALHLAMSVPFGKYCRSSPLRCSLLPRCQGLFASAK
ncbi:hypothetical protein B7R21_19135, partial [Subtercola boreus]